MRSTVKRSLDRLTAGGAIDLADAVDRRDGFVETVDEEAGDAVVDQFGHRSAAIGDDRRAAGHRFDHRQAERLLEADQVEHRTGLTQRAGPVVAAQHAAIIDAIVRR